MENSSAHRVASVEAVIVDLPLVREQRFAALNARSQSMVLIFVRTSGGAEGVGEASLPSGPWWGGESVESIKIHVDEYLAPLMIGEDAFAIDAIMRKLDDAVFGNSFAKAGLEMALLDAQGKVLNTPVYNLLGGKARDSLPVSWPLATGDANQEIEEALGKIEARLHSVFKLKMGAVEPAKDLERACAIARALEGKATVRCDPNGRWDETTATWAIPRLADAGIDLLEQPLPRWNIEGCARLTANCPMVHMLDESVCSLQDMQRIAQLRAGSLISLKLMKSGGMRRSKVISELALGAGIPVYMGTFLESSFGTGANMQFCATLGDLPYGGELAGALLVSESITQRPADYHDFELHLQDGVGLGVELDPDKLAAFRRDRNYSLHAVSS
ncbi:MAG: muconate cycloisomerase family protein [Pseudomonadota bacterium]